MDRVLFLRTLFICIFVLFSTVKCKFVQVDGSKFDNDVSGISVNITSVMSSESSVVEPPETSRYKSSTTSSMLTLSSSSSPRVGAANDQNGEITTASHTDSVLSKDNSKTQHQDVSAYGDEAKTRVESLERGSKSDQTHTNLKIETVEESVAKRSDPRIPKLVGITKVSSGRPTATWSPQKFTNNIIEMKTVSATTSGVTTAVTSQSLTDSGESKSFTSMPGDNLNKSAHLHHTPPTLPISKTQNSLKRSVVELSSRRQHISSVLPSDSISTSSFYSTIETGGTHVPPTIPFSSTFDGTSFPVKDNSSESLKTYFKFARVGILVGTTPSSEKRDSAIASDQWASTPATFVMPMPEDEPKITPTARTTFEKSKYKTLVGEKASITINELVPRETGRNPTENESPNLATDQGAATRHTYFTKNFIPDSKSFHAGIETSLEESKNKGKVLKANTSLVEHITQASQMIPPATRNAKPVSLASNKKYITSRLEQCSNDTPPYKYLRQSNTSYEIRVYPAVTWLSVNVITNNRILAELEAMDKLRKYFEGKNEKGIRLNLTCPVLTQIKFKGFSVPREKINEYAVSFYVPGSDNGKDIPSPDDSEILVDADEQRTVFVHSFQARIWEMTDWFLQGKVKKMFTALRSNGEAFLSDYFYLASYTTSPTDVNLAEYELWVYATRYHRHQEIGSSRSRILDEPLSEITRRTRSRVCKGLECPKFDVLSVHKNGIQKRRYYGARFATYYPEFCSFTKGSIWKAFMPLHLYKHGVNSHFEVIRATRPAGILHVKENPGNACNQTFSVSLYLPKRLHAAPPAAGLTEPQIKITELDDVIVYVQSIGGFLLAPERIYREITLFRSRLQQQHICFRKNEYYLVVYDYITRFHGRLNEIWIVADLCTNSL